MLNKGTTADLALEQMLRLNPVHFQVNMPEDKAKIVAGLEAFLAEHSPEEIERMVNRREMRSL